MYRKYPGFNGLKRVSGPLRETGELPRTEPLSAEGLEQTAPLSGFHGRVEDTSVRETRRLSLADLKPSNEVDDSADTADLTQAEIRADEVPKYYGSGEYRQTKDLVQPTRVFSESEKQAMELARQKLYDVPATSYLPGAETKPTRLLGEEMRDRPQTEVLYETRVLHPDAPPTQRIEAVVTSRLSRGLARLKNLASRGKTEVVNKVVATKGAINDRIEQRRLREEQTPFIDRAAKKTKITLLNLNPKTPERTEFLQRSTEGVPTTQLPVEHFDVKPTAILPRITKDIPPAQLVGKEREDAQADNVEPTRLLNNGNVSPALQVEVRRPLYPSNSEGVTLPLKSAEDLAFDFGLTELDRQSKERIEQGLKLRTPYKRSNIPARPDLWVGSKKERANLRKFKELAMNLYEQGVLTLDGPSYHLAPEMPAHEFKKYTEALAEVKKEFRKKLRHESQATQRLDANLADVEEQQHDELVSPAAEILREPELTPEQRGAVASVFFALLARALRYRAANNFFKGKYRRR